MAETAWEQQAMVARDVGTQFWPLGRAKTQAVVGAAYAQTMAHLHLKLGTPFHQLPNI